MIPETEVKRQIMVLWVTSCPGFVPALGEYYLFSSVEIYITFERFFTWTGEVGLADTSFDPVGSPVHLKFTKGSVVKVL